MTMIHREDLPGRQVRLTISVGTEAWQQALADAYRENHAFYPVEGYAPGTAPRDALEAAYAPDILYQEAVNLTFPTALLDALRQQQLEMAGTPQLSVAEIGPEGYSFHAVVDLYPEVELGQYKGLSAPFAQVELSNDDVEAALGDYCRAHTVRTEVERAAMGDEVTLDFEGFVDGEAFEGGKGEAFPLVLGSGMFIPGFEDPAPTLLGKIPLTSPISIVAVRKWSAIIRIAFVLSAFSPYLIPLAFSKIEITPLNISIL